MSKQERLSKELSALLESQSGAAVSGRASPGTAASVEMHIAELRPGRYQPRRNFSAQSLAELAASIREQGVLQPLIVRAVPMPQLPATPAYEIVAGERRWRAARLAGLLTVPVLLRELSDQSAQAIALIENLQREDLNPIDQATSLARLTHEFELTHEQAAQAIGRSRASVSNLLRLLDLHEEVKDLLAHGKIDMGHARALLPLDADRQVAMARKTDKRRLSVRQVERAVRVLLSSPADSTRATPSIDMQTRWLQQQIAKELDTKFAVRPDRHGNYTLQVGFANLAQLQEALQRIGELIGQIRETAGPRVRDAHH